MRGLIIIFLCFQSLCSYAPREFFFKELLTERQSRDDGRSSNVVVVGDVPSFYREVVCSRIPVVVKIVADGDNPFLQKSFQELADEFSGRVLFVTANVSNVFQVVNSIMSKLRMRQINLPMILFFKSGTLVPPMLTGFVPKENLTKFIGKAFFGERG
jgi:hypothetical protein